MRAIAEHLRVDVLSYGREILLVNKVLFQDLWLVLAKGLFPTYVFQGMMGNELNQIFGLRETNEISPVEDR